MNAELRRLAEHIGLDEARHRHLRLGLACVERVRHLLVDEGAVEALAVERVFARGGCDEDAYRQALEVVTRVAAGHLGSGSVDGAGHAAVSATFAVSKALAGHAVDAAEYAAYASVYAYGSYAVNDPRSFQQEYAWQVAKLRELAGV